MAQPSGRIVAELGRPETPEETAARKARDSRLYRERKTLSNLIYALLATLAAVVVIVVATPRSDTPIERTIDAAAIAEKSAVTLGATPLVPAVDGTVNAAEVRTSSDGITAWYVGFVTAGKEYLGMVQAVDANPSWVANQIGNTPPTGAIEIGGLHWLTYDNRDSDTAPNNAQYAMATEFTAVDGTRQTVVLLGTAANAEFVAAANAVAQANAQVQ